MKVNEARIVELEKEATENTHYKKEIEKANAKIKELEEKLQESIERATAIEEKGKNEIAILKKTHEERENSLLEKIKKLEAELESLELQHQLDTKGKLLFSDLVDNYLISLCIAISSSRSEEEWSAVEQELLELREHHQRTLKDYARMEQRLENLQSELEMMRNQGRNYNGESEYSRSSGFHTTTNSNFCLEDTAHSLPDLHFSLQSSTPISSREHQAISDLKIQLETLEKQNLSLLEENSQLKKENKKISVGKKEEAMRELYEREIETLKESKLKLAEELKALKHSKPSLVQVSLK